MEHLIGKLILGFIILLFGVYYALKRSRKNKKSSNKSQEIADKITRELNFAPEFAKTLIFQCGFQACPHDFSFGNFIRLIKQFDHMGGYEFVMVKELPSDRCLFITTCNYDEFDISAKGLFGDVAHKKNLNFLVTYNRTNNQVVVFSDLERTNRGKALRSSFANLICKQIVN